MEAERGALGLLGAGASPLPSPTLLPVNLEGQGLTDGIFQRNSVLRVRGLCPLSVPTPDGKAGPECCGEAGGGARWREAPSGTGRSWPQRQNLCGNLTPKTLHPRAWRRTFPLSA